MQETHDALHARLDACLVSMQSIRDIKAKSTIWKVYDNCRKCWTDLDVEMVNCRRQRRVTLKYTELEAEFLEHIHTFEQWLLMATLMY